MLIVCINETAFNFSYVLGQNFIVTQERLAVKLMPVVWAETTLDGNQVGSCKRMLTTRNGERGKCKLSIKKILRYWEITGCENPHASPVERAIVQHSINC